MPIGRLFIYYKHFIVSDVISKLLWTLFPTNTLSNTWMDDNFSLAGEIVFGSN